MPPRLAAKLVLRVIAEKLKAPGVKNNDADADSAYRNLDVCVSHDMTLLLVRDQLLGESVAVADVEFLVRREQ